MMVRISLNITILLIIAFSPILNEAIASEKSKPPKYQFGGRSMLINGSMNLSKIDSSFDDLSYDGIDGPHHSSLFLMRFINEYFRIGIETLTGNSETKKNTTMNFQGVGILLDAIHGERFFINGGIHAGPIIVNAMSNSGGEINDGVNSGTHYKDSGLFIAPYLGVGVKFSVFDLSLITKWVEVASGEQNDNIEAFSAQYIGLSLGINF